MNTQYIAPYILRLYLWEVLKLNLGLDDADYDIDNDSTGFIPIVPLGEEPELENFDKPYMVYGFAESPITSTRQGGNLMLVIYSTSFHEMSQVANTIVNTFESDWAVDEVNAFSSTIPAFLGLRFGMIQGTAIEGGTPESESGGRMTTTVNIKYEYFGNYDVDNKIAQWNVTTQKYEKL